MLNGVRGPSFVVRCNSAAKVLSTDNEQLTTDHRHALPAATLEQVARRDLSPVGHRNRFRHRHPPHLATRDGHHSWTSKTLHRQHPRCRRPRRYIVRSAPEYWQRLSTVVLGNGPCWRTDRHAKQSI